MACYVPKCLRGYLSEPAYTYRRWEAPHYRTFASFVRVGKSCCFFRSSYRRRQTLWTSCHSCMLCYLGSGAAVVWDVGRVGPKGSKYHNSTYMGPKGYSSPLKAQVYTIYLHGPFAGVRGMMVASTTLPRITLAPRVRSACCCNF